jgi:hypothetical protein
MNKTTERLIFIGLALLVAVGGYLWWKRQETPPPPVAKVEAPPAPAPAPAEPEIEHPIAQAEPPEPLPALADSDAAIRKSLAAAVGEKVLGEFLIASGIVRKIVATVDNLPRPKLSQKILPVKPASGNFIVAGAGAGADAVIAADNAARYAPYVKAAEAIDTKKLVEVYVRFYPLFQQAYRELGYPKGYFNDRLVQVIDHLLLTPEIKGPIRVAQPKVLYEFADPELESRSAGQKLLMRIGVDNAVRIKAKLREIRREVARSEVAKPN